MSSVARGSCRRDSPPAATSPRNVRASGAPALGAKRSVTRVRNRITEKAPARRAGMPLPSPPARGTTGFSTQVSVSSVMARQMIMPTLFFRKLVQRIRDEFEYFPDLCLTASEAARFWGLDLATSERVLSELLLSGFLTRSADNRYRHVAWGPRQFICVARRGHLRVAR